MVCLIASSYRDAVRWAKGQMLNDNEWFYPVTKEDIKARKNFITIVVNGGDIPNGYLNEMLMLAWKYGRSGN